MLSKRLFALGLILSPLTALAADPEVTVYNQNFALVKDYETMDLKKGRNVVNMDDAAALVDPTSVHFKSLTDPKGVTVEEQNFRYDLINKANILDRMVGQKIRFYRDKEIKEGILLNPATNIMRNQDYYGGRASYGSNGYSNMSTGEFAVQTAEGILVTNLNDIIIDKLPTGLYPRPTLVWQLFADKPGSHKTEVSYLTDGMNWSCDYVAVISANDDKVDLTGWVTLDNNSGRSYDNAYLKLVAGDVRKLQSANMPVPMMMKADVMGAAESRQSFQEESFFEYHLYTLSQRTSINNRETKQVGLVSAANVPVTKQYQYDPSPVYRTYAPNGNSAGKVTTRIVLTNSVANQLGMALPKGKVRVNKADSSGSLQFVGEDQIDHTPKDEKIELYLGDAFDIVGEQKRTNYRQDNNWTYESFEVSLRNHKKVPVRVDVLGHPYGDWRVTDNSLEFKKDNANQIRFSVSVPADGEQTVNYTVQTKRN